MKSSLYIHYENELKKVEKEIMELWEVGKVSAAKNDRKRQLEYVLIGMDADKTIKELRERIQLLERRLRNEGIEILGGDNNGM